MQLAVGYSLLADSLLKDDWFIVDHKIPARNLPVTSCKPTAAFYPTVTFASFRMYSARATTGASTILPSMAKTPIPAAVFI